MSWILRARARAHRLFVPRPNLEAQNIRNLYAEIGWFGILSGIASSFLSVYTLRVGGSDTHIGLLSSLPALIISLASLPGSRLVEREKKPLSVMMLSATLHRFGYLAIALVPFFFTTSRADVIVALVALLTIPQAIASVAFTTMFARAVPPDKRARVVSVRNVWIGITTTLAAFFGGKFLDWVIFPINYQILFALGFATALVNLYYLARIRLPAAPVEPRRSETPQGVRALLAMLRAQRGFVRFTVSSFVFHWGMFFVGPLYTIYWVRNLQATEGWIGLFSVIANATTIFFFPIWARIATRFGNRAVMIGSAAGLALYPFCTAFAPTVEWILGVSLLGGVFTAGFSLSFFNGLLEISPEQNRASYIAAYNSFVNLAAFASPIVSTSLTSLFTIPALLLFGAGLRLFGALMIWQQRVLVKTR